MFVNKKYDKHIKLVVDRVLKLKSETKSGALAWWSTKSCRYGNKGWFVADFVPSGMLVYHSPASPLFPLTAKCKGVNPDSERMSTILQAFQYSEQRWTENWLESVVFLPGLQQLQDVISIYGFLTSQ